MVDILYAVCFVNKNMFKPTSRTPYLFLCDIMYVTLYTSKIQLFKAFEMFLTDNIVLCPIYRR